MTIAPGNAFNPHDRVTADPVGKSRTKQAFKDEVDINEILRKHEKGLLTDHLNEHQGQYGDFIIAGDFHSHMNLIKEAENAFMTIPAEIRAKFNNDPAEFLAFAQDPEKLDEMRKMGLAPPDRPKTPREPPMAPATASEAVTVPTALPEEVPSS